MERILIEKGAVPGFLDALLPHYRVVAPARAGGRLEFSRIRSGGEAVLSDELPADSPKRFLFPPSECFLEYGGEGDPAARSDAQPTVILGVHPCDLYALKVLGEVFEKGRYEDPVYRRHRENTVMIGLGCAREKPGCFCLERGIDRAYSPDCDALLTDLGDRYAADVLTEAGRGLLDRFLPGLPREGAPERGAGPRATLELEADEAALFERVDWARISETCLGCGACTYLCPTCHCFGFRDVQKGGAARRYRVWDSCMFPKFTLHASGHNPRPSKAERYRQRVLHKYLYLRRNLGLTACSGCARCVRSCPAGMDIRAVVRGIMEGLTG